MERFRRLGVGGWNCGGFEAKIIGKSVNRWPNGKPWVSVAPGAGICLTQCFRFTGPANGGNELSVPIGHLKWDRSHFFHLLWDGLRTLSARCLLYPEEAIRPYNMVWDFYVPSKILVALFVTLLGACAEHLPCACYESNSRTTRDPFCDRQYKIGNPYQINESGIPIDYNYVETGDCIVVRTEVSQ